MKKFENWMKKGSEVFALGEAGRITKVEKIDQYVTAIWVRSDETDQTAKYHPASIKPVTKCLNTVK